MTRGELVQRLYTGGGERSSVVSGSLWMVGISVALFFLPAINGFVGGLVGGYKVGGLRRALTAAVLPAGAVGVLLWIVLAIVDAPVVGFLSGVAALGLIVLSSLGLLIGAAVGGALSPKHRATSRLP